MHTLTLRIAACHIPEAGAVCGSFTYGSVRGRQVTGVPNATAAVSPQFILAIDVSDLIACAYLLEAAVVQSGL